MVNGVDYGPLHSKIGEAVTFNLCGPSPSGNLMKKATDTNPLNDACGARIHIPRVKDD